MQKRITPFLWFDGDARKPAKFYASIFKKTKILDRSEFSSTFELEGQRMIAFNGGPHFQFSPAISFLVSCKTQKEVDHYWKKLGSKGKPGHCGWLTDRFGVTWQIVPEILEELLSDSNREKADRAHEAMMKMKKLDIAKLKKAHAGKR